MSYRRLTDEPDVSGPKSIEEIAEELVLKGSYKLPYWSDPKRFKRLLREDHDLQVRSDSLGTGGFLLTLIIQKKQEPKPKPRIVQALLPGLTLEDALRRGPTFVGKIHEDYLRSIDPGSVTQEPYGDGVIVTLNQ